MGNGNFFEENDSEGVNGKIYDYYDNLNKGKVLRADEFSSQLIIDPKTPISSPKSVEKIGVAGGLDNLVKCRKRLAGYRVHYGSPSGYGYANVVNVGTDLYTISGLSVLDEVNRA